MENLVYWCGVVVGIEQDGRIIFFTSASKEAIAALS